MNSYIDIPTTKEFKLIKIPSIDLYIFNSKGRLMQVEYAIEAINKTGSAIGILTKEGIVLVTEKQDVGSLLEQSKNKNFESSLGY